VRVASAHYMAPGVARRSMRNSPDPTPEPETATTIRIMTDSLRFTILFEEGENGWIVAQVKEVPGAISQGRTREEARENVIDALRLMLSPEPEDSGAEGESVELTLR